MTTLDDIIRPALALGARIDLAITPQGYYPPEQDPTQTGERPDLPDDDPIDAAPDADTRLLHVGDTMDIDVEDVTMTYRVAALNGRGAAWMVPTTVWPERMDYGETNQWTTSKLREWMNGWYHDHLPETIRRRILDHHMILADGSVDICPVWAPSEEQAYGSAIFGKDEHPGVEKLFADRESRRLTDPDGNQRWWWLRSAYSSNTSLACLVGTGGSAYWNYVNGTLGSAVPCFCLGPAR